MNNVLRADNIHKYYQSGERELQILRGLNLDVSKGEMIAIVGQSGIGKTTLLNILGGLDRPTSGRILLNGDDFYLAGDKKRSLLRNKEVGFVFQFHHLLNEFTALENVMIPLLISRENIAAAKKKAEQILDAVGLKERVFHRPSKLSGGERQRVAVARALVTDPAIILADEPSGNLDAETAGRLHALLFQLNEAMGQTFIIVTHNNEFAKQCGRTLTLRDGIISEE